MKTLLRMFLLVVILGNMTACDMYSNIEPDHWQKEQFMRQVRKSVRKAIQAPGVDNGSTLLVTVDGDTLLMPADSALRAMPVRTVYVEIEPPTFPKVVSSHAVKMFTALTVIGLICFTILIILIGVFITVWRRQASRTRAVTAAINDSYQLPEAFYTGVPSAAPVSITQYVTSDGAVSATTAPAPGAAPGAEPAPDPVAGDAADAIRSGIRKAVSGLGAPDSARRAKQLYVSFILVGIGFMLFLAFASNGNEGFGFFAGGSIFVIGVAKLLSLFMTKRM